jgi:hypothetical protein
MPCCVKNIISIYAIEGFLSFVRGCRQKSFDLSRRVKLEELYLRVRIAMTQLFAVALRTGSRPWQSSCVVAAKAESPLSVVPSRSRSLGFMGQGSHRLNGVQLARRIGWNYDRVIHLPSISDLRCRLAADRLAYG